MNISLHNTDNLLISDISILFKISLYSISWPYYTIFIWIITNYFYLVKFVTKNNNKVAYLTFDDGPSPLVTPKILQILSEENVKATFFVVHYSDENAKYIKQEANEGHTVALHGYTHTYSEVYQSVDSCLENFRKIEEQVKGTIGKDSKIIRFPGGGSNTVSRKYCPGVMTEVTNRVIEEGYRYFDWNTNDC